MNEIISFLILLGLEIVLSVDNTIYISIAISSLTPKQRDNARAIALILAIIMRILTLILCFFIIKHDFIIFSFFKHNINISNLIYLVLGGMLLLKSISEFIDIKKHKYFKIIRYYKNFKDVIQQIFIINFVLAIDSTATAVGLTNYATIAILSILVTIIIMCFATKKLSALIYANLSIKLVTSFVILIISLLMILKGLLIKCDVNMFYIAFLLAMIIEIVKITYLKEEGK